MIRDGNTINGIKVNVKLKSGELFEGKDTTSSPMGKYERCIGFWHDGKIRMYSLRDVEYVEFVEEDK